MRRQTKQKKNNKKNKIGGRSNNKEQYVYRYKAILYTHFLGT